MLKAVIEETRTRLMALLMILLASVYIGSLNLQWLWYWITVPFAVLINFQCLYFIASFVEEQPSGLECLNQLYQMDEND